MYIVVVVNILEKKIKKVRLQCMKSLQYKWNWERNFSSRYMYENEVKKICFEHIEESLEN